MRSLLVLIVITVAAPLVLLGCITDRPLSRGHPGQQKLPTDIETLFAYMPVPVYTEERPVNQKSNDIQFWQATFESEFSVPEKNPIRVEIWCYAKLSNKPLPAVVIPTILNTKTTLERYFANYFARRGFAAFIINGKDDNTDLRSFNNFDEALVKLVIEQRKALDYIVSLPEIDIKHIFLFGISMGGIKATYLAAIDHRVAGSVIVLAGGNLPYLMTHSTEPGVKERLAQLMDANNMSVEEMEKHLRQTIQQDPMRYAPYIDATNTFMVIGRRDTAVPFVVQEQLRAAIGYPQACYLPTGHLSSVICIPFIQGKAVRFFQERVHRDGQ